MFSVEQVVHFHDQAIDLYSGSKGIRDLSAFDSASKRPFPTFASKDLYPTCFEKAAAIPVSIVLNHPFMDGNKRTTFLLFEALLEDRGFTINSGTDDIYNFWIKIGTGDFSFDQVVEWLR